MPFITITIIDCSSSGQAIATAIVITITSSLFIIYHKFIKESKPILRQLNIYPIKSCGEMSLNKAKVTPMGFRHDRIFQVVSKKTDDVYSYCRPRDVEYEKMFHIYPKMDDDGKILTLTSKDGDRFNLDLNQEQTKPLSVTVMGSNGDIQMKLNNYGDAVSVWIEKVTGIDSPRLVGIPPDGYDRQIEINPKQCEALPSDELNGSNYPVSLANESPFLLTTHESLNDLNKRLSSSGKKKVDMRRFRPNIVISGLKPYEEDTLKRIRIGTVEFHVWQRCGRCPMTTVDRDTLQRCGEPLITLGTFRERANGQRNFGMHLIPCGVGEIRVGDEVEILEYDVERRKEWISLFCSGGKS